MIFKLMLIFMFMGESLQMNLDIPKCYISKLGKKAVSCLFMGYYKAIENNETLNKIKNCRGDNDFENKINKAQNKLAVIYFTNKLDSHKSIILTYFYSQANEYLDVDFIKADIDSCKTAASINHVTTVPSFVFKKNKENVLQFEGENDQILKDFVEYYRSTTPEMPNSTVISIIDNNDFNEKEKASRDKLIVVVLFSKTINECNSFFPIIENLSRKNPHVVFLKVNTDDCNWIKQCYNITSKTRLPAIKFLINNHIKAYFEGPDVTQLINNLQSYRDTFEMPKTYVRWVYSEDDFTSKLNMVKYPLVVVYFVKRFYQKCDEWYPSVHDMAESNRNILFLKVDIDFCYKTASLYKVESVPMFVIFKFKNEIERLAGSDIDKLKKVLLENRPPPSKEVTFIKNESQLGEVLNSTVGLIVIEAVDNKNPRDSFRCYPLDTVIENYSPDVLFLNVNLDECTEFKKLHQIQSVPVFIYYRKDSVFVLAYPINREAMEANIRNFS